MHPSYAPEDVASLYRDAFTLGRGTVNYDSFTAAAEVRRVEWRSDRVSSFHPFAPHLPFLLLPPLLLLQVRQFYSSAMRLPPLLAGAGPAVAAAAPLPLTREQCAAVAFAVDGHWRALEYDIAPWLAQARRTMGGGEKTDE